MFALLIATAPCAETGPVDVPRIVIYADFPLETSKYVLDAIIAEVGVLISSGGVEVAWYSLKTGHQQITHGSLAVVKFKGRCEPDYTGPHRAKQKPLGQTHAIDGQIVSFADIDCDAVRTLLTRQLAVTPPGRHNHVYGRAVARVVAHELYHVMTRSAEHAPSGIAQPAFRPKELTAEQFAFRDCDIRSLRASASPNPGRLLFLESGCQNCHAADARGTERAPPLRGTHRSARRLNLTAVLFSTASKMTSEAGKLTASWRTLTKRDVAAIQMFLSK